MNGIVVNLLKLERQTPLRNIYFSGQMKQRWIETCLRAEMPALNRLITSTAPLE
jgi:hypothetical protein